MSTQTASAKESDMTPTVYPTSPASTATRTVSGPPAGRDRFLDLLRVAALAVVVIWHYSLTTVSWNETGPHTDNPAGTIPWLWLLTWIVQPMCVFFAVGGALHSRDRRRPVTFWKARCRRLLPPVLPLLAIAAGLYWLASVNGRGDLAHAVILAVSPLWFLAVYLVLIALAPLARLAHDRIGWAAPVVLASLVAVVDYARFTGRFASRDGLWPTLLLFVLTWACVHQLGFHLDELRAGSRRAALAMSGVGLALLVALSTFGPYPKAMVGSSADSVSNMGPPNLMVVALALFQLGLLVAVAGAVTRFAHRHTGKLDVAARWTMPVYVWHLTAFCVFFIVADRTGLQDAHIDAGWWLTRPVWLVGPALVCAGLVYLVSKVSSLASRLPKLPRARLVPSTVR
jgi:peptidoglycan/LPS O-acetylase OafA/YrhL